MLPKKSIINKLIVTKINYYVDWNGQNMKNQIVSIFYDINNFSLPLILNRLFNLSISIILTAIIGRISVNAIISTEIIDTLSYAILGIAGVGTLVFNIESSKVRLVSEEDYLNWFKSCYLVNGFIGLIIIITTFLFSKDLFYYVYNMKNLELDIICKYSYIASFSIFANMLIFSMSNLLKVNKKTKYILFAGVVGAIFQVVLAYVLVYYVFDGNNKILGVGISSTLTVIFELFMYILILRKEIVKTFYIKSSKKKELVIKSIPLILQETLEGSVFSVLIITLIARLGESIISSYSISIKVVSFCLLPMYMYCNAITVLAGEYYSKKEYCKMKILPVITTSTTIAIYIIISALAYIYQRNVVSVLTDIHSVQIKTTQILIMVIIFSVFQIFFENSKYVLQSIGKSKEVLLTTAIINGSAIIFLVMLSYLSFLNLMVILSTLAINYLCLSIFFYRKYSKEVNKYIAIS